MQEDTRAVHFCFYFLNDHQKSLQTFVGAHTRYHGYEKNLFIYTNIYDPYADC